MNKQEIQTLISELNLDANKFCVISGGMMVLYDLRSQTEDLDLAICSDYLSILKNRFSLFPTGKYPNHYSFSFREREIEIIVKDLSHIKVEFIQGIPVNSIVEELEWKLKNKREKDQKDILLIQNYLKEKKH